MEPAEAARPYSSGGSWTGTSQRTDKEKLSRDVPGEVEAVSQELKSLETREVEAIEAMVISSEAHGSTKDQIKKAQ